MALDWPHVLQPQKHRPAGNTGINASTLPPCTILRDALNLVDPVAMSHPLQSSTRKRCELLQFVVQQQLAQGSFLIQLLEQA